jgi:hypothetical protein
MHIFISMEKFKKSICIRISGEDFHKLSEVLVDKHLKKSMLLRSLIQDYLQFHYHKTEGLGKAN